MHTSRPIDATTNDCRLVVWEKTQSQTTVRRPQIAKIGARLLMASYGHRLFVRQQYVLVENAFSVLDSLYSLVYAYNFVVYVITGTQFRAELRRLLCF